MQVLITGGAGFIGSHLLLALQKHPEHKITVLDNLTSGSQKNIPQNVELVQMDIRSRDLEDCFKKHHFAAVIHLAAQTMVPFSMDHPQTDCDINLMGLLNVLECCRKYKVGTVLFSSSAAVYGDNENVPIKETESLKPTSFYGLTKMTTENYLRIYHDIYGLNTIIFRFANVYGERQGESGEGGVVSIFCKLLAAGKTFTVFGDGKQTRDFVYAGDIAEALVGGLTLKGFHVINVSTATETSINQLISCFEKASGKKAEVKYLAARQGDIYRSFLANTTMKNTLGFTPAMPLAQGIEKTLAWFITEKGATNA
jgi:UDP-glucose 4-epimerase